MRIIYRVSGGVPIERPADQELHISGDGSVTLRRISGSEGLQLITAKLDQSDIVRLFQQLSSGMTSLVPRDQAKFIPDSVVGSITIEVDGQQTTRYFLVDEDDRRMQGRPITPIMANVTGELARLSQQLR
jgi:hypothetical protein